MQPTVPTRARNGGDPPQASLHRALRCARQGWPVHPLAPGRKTPAANCADCQGSRHTHDGCACLAEGRPCHGFYAATLDEERIRRWWGSNPNYGVGVACGPAGLVVIDIDAHTTRLADRDRLLPGIAIPDTIDLTGLESGFHTIAVLAALHEEPSPADDDTTLRVRTPSGGLHVWYRTRPGHRMLSSTGAGKKRALAWQVDVRGLGGYIVTPGTVTAGGTYAVQDGARVPRLLPTWLSAELERTGHREPPVVASTAPVAVPSRAAQAISRARGLRGSTTGSALDRTIATVLADVHACAAVPEGASFSEKLNRAAFTMGGLVAAGRLSVQAAEDHLTAAAEHARPGQARRAHGIIRSGMAAGHQRPLHTGGHT
ncbi:hypothetical protein GCM10023205_52760 [Yinghuangia aomiensis]|uniref:DNA primase/polymerase bifunctional N-terminal domain-containing protein n=1 Tax=Yinghuangia aomiensis TaxID=676205 RepID=A0ABP9HU31_9ACTN